jgi:hypothetical protein
VRVVASECERPSRGELIVCVPQTNERPSVVIAIAWSDDALT